MTIVTPGGKLKFYFFNFALASLCHFFFSLPPVGNPSPEDKLTFNVLPREFTECVYVEFTCDQREGEIVWGGLEGKQLSVNYASSHRRIS